MIFLQVGSAERKEKKKERLQERPSGNSSDCILALTYKTLNESSITKKVRSGRTKADAVIADGGDEDLLRVHSHFLPKQMLLGRTTTQCFPFLL